MSKNFFSGKVTPIATLLVTAMLALALTALAGGHGHKRPVKKAILLVTFGTSIPKAQGVFKIIDRRVKRAYPRKNVRWAYTSKMIRQKMAKRGVIWLSPSQALAKLMEDGFTHVAVQSLHVIPGKEFHDLVSVVTAFRRIKGGFTKVVLGNPLCATTDDLKAVTGALMAGLPKGRKRNEAIIFMGHGTHHPAGVVYPALAYLLALKDRLVFMGTVEGYPELKDILPRLKAKGVKKAYLLPFMTVAGDHAINDMAGPDKDSWKSVLQRNGIRPVPVLRAITENPAIVDVWLRHLAVVMRKLRGR